MFESEIEFIKKLYQKKTIPLHEPVFQGNEEKYVVDCIRSTFVSSVGNYVNQFEDCVKKITGAKFAIATTNGTSALHIALVVMGVKSDDEVITQNVTFIATVNAISYCSAHPVLLDCDKDNLALSPQELEKFLELNAEVKNGECYNKKTGRRIKACVPMHVFGYPAKIDSIVNICKKWKMGVIEDAAESLGSYYKGKHTGTFGDVGILSFNGNKIVTTGGGGMVITDDADLAHKLKHLTTTAKVPHAWEFVHDEIGYNYRLPNLNAALGVAQMEMLESFLVNKKKTAEAYTDFFKSRGIVTLTDPPQSVSNYWLYAIVLNNREERDTFLKESNSAGIMARPLWTLISDLKIYQHCLHGELKNSRSFQDRIVNLPSGVRPI